jgi:hypothetical protein
LALPDPPLVIVSHPLLLTAVHEQPLPLVTETLPVPPLDEIFRDVGVTPKVHGAAPFCVTEIVMPATVSEPLRLLVDVFAATEKLTDPFPVREPPPLVTVIQPLLLVAFQVQPFPVVTFTLPDPPAAAIVCASGVAVNVHGGAENEN